MKIQHTVPDELPLYAPSEVPGVTGSAPETCADKGETVLKWVVPGDPLEVRTQVSRRLRERCLLLDPHGVSVQALASIAADQRGIALAEGGEDEQDKRLRAKTLVENTVERVIDDCVAGRIEVPVAGLSRGGVLSQLCSVLKLSNVELERACKRFNRLPAEARRAFHALILQRRTLESACRRSASAAESWSKGAAKGLATILGKQEDFPVTALDAAEASVSNRGMLGGGPN